MKLETYFKYKKQVIDNFNKSKKNELGMMDINDFIKPVKKNKQLFLFIFSYDTKPYVNNVVKSIFKGKAYYSYSGTQICKIKLGKANLLEKRIFQVQYEKLLEHIKTNLKK